MTDGTVETGRRSRHRRILELVSVDRRVSVASLKEMFGVSEMTIRRDLASLQASGVLRRVHGGAVCAERHPFESRTVRFREEKARIAKRVADMLGSGVSLAIDIGTTTHYVARALRERSDLFVVTNSINVAVELRQSASKVLLVGGLVLPELSLVGTLATDAIRRLRVNKLVLGCGGITLDRGLVYFDIDEVDVRRAMLDIADEVIIVADHSKFGRDDTVSLAPIGRADVIVTDAEPPPAYQDCCARNGVELIVV